MPIAGASEVSVVGRSFLVGRDILNGSCIPISLKRAHVTESGATYP